VRGFAFVLGLTTLFDVLIVFLFTKPIISVLAQRPFFAKGHPWSGVDPRRLGVEPPQPELVGASSGAAPSSTTSASSPSKED
jgi:preprotein translocase subunit SecD